MAWRIHESVIRGELDNRRRGRVVGRIWLAGRAAPLTLDLEGNPLRDMAGCRLTFENRAMPKHEVSELIELNQSGYVGDMTASRKVRVFEAPVAPSQVMSKAGLVPPKHWANALYLEWYSDRNGRIVIESAGCHATLSDPAWRMSVEEEKAQARANAEAMSRFLRRVSGLDSAAARRAEIEDASSRASPIFSSDETPMDEFGWERFLRESDARTEVYGKILDKYAHMSREEAERLAAREMGWTHIEEYLAACDDRTARPGDDLASEDEYGEPDLPEELLPNPATEGVDWIRDERGNVVHPLEHKADVLGFKFRRECEKLGLLDKDGSEAMEDLVFSLHGVAVKLAGALNSLAYESDPDRGFIVAYLKRALKPLHDALRQSEQIRAQGLVEADRLIRLDRDLLALRADILRLMRENRAPNPEMD